MKLVNHTTGEVSPHPAPTGTRNGGHHHTPPTRSTPAAFMVQPSQQAGGVGIFATRDLEPGTVLACCAPMATSRHRTRTSFECGRGQHVELSYPAELINHACDPNLAVRDNQLGGLDFIVIRKVSAGQELRTHYGMHEWRSTSVSKCHCGSRGLCRGRSLGYAEVDDGVRAMLTELGSAGHLTADDSDQPPRGLHATINVHGILPLAVPRGDIEGRNKVRLFLDQLVRVIGMSPHGEPVMNYYPGDGSNRDGWTAVQLITTSSVTLHLYATGSAWIDISSCQAFDVRHTAEWCRKHLKGTTYDQATMELV